MPLFMAVIVENERIGSRLAGSALGVIGTVAGIGPVMMPYLMGAVMDATDEYWPGFLLLAILLAAGAVMGTAIKETGLRAKKAASAG